MIDAKAFVTALRAAGYDRFTGVPCSYLTPLINHVIGDPSLHYFPAANEGDAVAFAAGAWLGGQPAVVMMQNSGLGNAVSPLTSLNHTFGIPLLLICTHRGAADVPDEPQHALMGEITGALLDLMRIPREPFPASPAAVGPALARAAAHHAAARGPYALLMPKGAVAPCPLVDDTAQTTAAVATIKGAPAPASSGRPSRAEALRAVIEATPLDNAVVVATTGFTGRELYALNDRANHFYMVGSMGCASALGLGLALACPHQHVVVVDGDGAALMRMGNMAMSGRYGPANLSHVLLDNEVHDSTGAQATLSASVDFAAVAAACAYGEVWRAAEVNTLGQFLARPRQSGAGFIHLKTAPGSLPDLPRPHITPPAAMARLRRHLGLA